MKPSLKYILLSAAIVPLLANAQNTQSYTPAAFDNTERLQQIKTVFPVIKKLYQDFAEKNHYPGYAFGIVVDGQLVYAGGGGYIDIEHKIPATPHSMFRVASMTKSFTAMSILKLRDAGKLRLDDPVYQYIPALKNQKLTQDAPDITIRDLLTHSAGFPTDDPWGDRKLADTNEELLAFLNHGVSFAHSTGTAYEYSNLGYATLGYIINKVSGQSYEKYISDNIWQPLGIKQAVWEYTQVPAAQLAQGYRWQDGQWIKEPMLHDGSFGAMGGMITSVDSFSRYVALHLSVWPPRDDADTAPLKRSSIREMQRAWRFAELRMPDTLSIAYGYGLQNIHDQQGRQYVGHSGGLPGFGSNWLIMPEYGIGVIFFANLTYADAPIINLSVIQTLVSQAHLQPRRIVASALLQERKAELLKLLPDWKNAESSGLFAKNFFLDYSADYRNKATQTVLAKAGKILQVEPLIAINQLRGSFVMKGEKQNIKVSFLLSPDKPALIQNCEITLEDHSG